MKLRILLTAMSLFGLALASCGGSDDATDATTATEAPGSSTTAATSTSPTTTSASTTTTAPDPEVPPEGIDVAFETNDGLTLEGRRFGNGDDFVVLAHMLPASMESWYEFAAVLADQGYSAIAFNFRGYGNSEGEGFSVTTDVTAAFDYAVESGAARVFAIGASMGGTGVLAATADREFAGVASLSAPTVFEGSDAVAGVAVSSAPLLLIAAEGDAPYPADAAELRLARADAEVLILSGARHGTDMFIDHGKDLEEVLVGFLANQG